MGYATNHALAGREGAGIDTISSMASSMIVESRPTGTGKTPQPLKSVFYQGVRRRRGRNLAVGRALLPVQTATGRSAHPTTGGKLIPRCCLQATSVAPRLHGVCWHGPRSHASALSSLRIRVQEVAEVAKTFGVLRCLTKLLASSATLKSSSDKALVRVSHARNLPGCPTTSGLLQAVMPPPRPLANGNLT